MGRKKWAAIVVVLLIATGLQAQYRSRRGGRGTATENAPALKGVIVTFHGALKKLTKKEILIQSDDNQLLTFRCSKKTKFLGTDGEIKATDIDLESPVTVSASEDTDLKLMAVSVKADPVEKKPIER